MTTSAPEGHDVACGISTPPNYGRCRLDWPCAPRRARSTPLGGWRRALGSGMRRHRGGGRVRPALPVLILHVHLGSTILAIFSPIHTRGSCDDEGYGDARWVGGGSIAGYGEEGP